MINPLSAAKSSDAFGEAPAPQAEPAPPPSPRTASAAKTQAEPDVRLTIEESPDGPFFVYTLQDRATGRIIAQLPRHRVTELGEGLGYKAGDLVRAKA